MTKVTISANVYAMASQNKNPEQHTPQEASHEVDMHLPSQSVREIDLQDELSKILPEENDAPTHSDVEPAETGSRARSRIKHLGDAANRFTERALSSGGSLSWSDDAKPGKKDQ